MVSPPVPYFLRRPKLIRPGSVGRARPPLGHPAAIRTEYHFAISNGHLKCPFEVASYKIPPFPPPIKTPKLKIDAFTVGRDRRARRKDLKRVKIPSPLSKHNKEMTEEEARDKMSS